MLYLCLGQGLCLGYLLLIHLFLGEVPNSAPHNAVHGWRSPVQSVLCCQKLMQHRSGIQSVSQGRLKETYRRGRADGLRAGCRSLAGLMTNCRFWILDESWASTRGNCFHARRGAAAAAGTKAPDFAKSYLKRSSS